MGTPYPTDRTKGERNTSHELIIFDVDGTLVEPASGGTFRKNAMDWKWIDTSRWQRIRELRSQGVRVALASNQGGVAFGYMKAKDILRELAEVAKDAHIAPGGIYVCYTHPKATITEYKVEDDRRKPGPGMLLDAM